MQDDIKDFELESEDTVEELDIYNFPKEVWDVLSRIDVQDYMETKGSGNFQAAYISWSNAWAILMRKFPASVYEHAAPIIHADQTMTVVVDVTVRSNNMMFSITRRMTLPVMDHKFNAIATPNARQVSDAYARCLVKALSLFGLGLDLWADTDGPVGSTEDSIDEDQVELIEGLLEKSEADRARFLKWCGVKDVIDIPNIRYKAARAQLERKIQQRSQS